MMSGDVVEGIRRRRGHERLCDDYSLRDRAGGGQPGPDSDRELTVFQCFGELGVSEVRCAFDEAATRSTAHQIAEARKSANSSNS